MEWLSLLYQYGPPVVSAIFAAIAMTQNQSAKKTVNQIAPTVGNIVSNLPQIIADVQQKTTPVARVETAVAEVAHALAPTLPQAAHVEALIDAVQKLTQSIDTHTAVVAQKQAQSS